MTYLWAHPTGKGKAGLVSESKALGTQLGAKVIPSLKDWKSYFKGDWNTWASAVPKRRSQTTGKVLYNAILLTNRTIGRATSTLIDAAIVAGMGVFLLEGQDQLVAISGIRTTDAQNWQSGWEVVTGQPEEDEKIEDFVVTDDPLADLFGDPLL